MTRDEAKDVIKRTVPVTEFLGKPDRYGFCNCPFCNSGEKEKKTPAMKVFPETNSCYCYSCHKGGDVINLYRNLTNADYVSSIKELASIAGVQVDGKSSPIRDIKITPIAEVEKKPEAHKDYSAFVDRACNKVNQTDFYKKRGLTDATIKKFKLGYKPDYITYTYENGIKHEHKIPVAIIPYNSKCSYFIAHAVKDSDIEQGFKHLKPSIATAGHEPVYNENALDYNAPCFVCEAPIDAISVMQVGGCAVAVGGTGTQKLIEAIKKRENYNKPLILSFDNDPPGQEALKEMSNELTKENIPFVVAGYSLMKYPNDKELDDPNSLLCADPALFAEDVKRIVNTVERVNEQKVEKETDVPRPIQQKAENKQYKKISEVSL